MHILDMNYMYSTAEQTFLHTEAMQQCNMTYPPLFGGTKELGKELEAFPAKHHCQFDHVITAVFGPCELRKCYITKHWRIYIDETLD